MLTDALKLCPASLRSNLPWLLFGAGIAIEFMAVRLAVQRAHVSTTAPPGPVPDIIATGELPSRVSEAAELPGMTEPITGGQVPDDPNRLPGAVRGYRGGVHEGVDFSCLPGTPVVAAADGWVLSVDDEPNLPESQRNELLRMCRRLGKTPAEVLRVLHGRRITLRHESGDGHLITSSYSHLDSVRPDLKPGIRVNEGEVIGASGSSGTSHAYRRGRWGEVHFEIRIDGQPLGLGYPPSKAAALYRACLGDVR